MSEPKQKLTKPELVAALQGLMQKHDNDREQAHIEADDLLLDFIGDAEIRDAFNSFEKWYS